MHHKYIHHYLLMVAILVSGCASDLARRVNEYEKVRDYEAARQLLKGEVQQNPENAEAQFLLGRVYMQQGEYVKGMESLKASRELSPRWVKDIDFLIKKYAREEFVSGTKAMKGDAFEEAVRHFRHVTQIQPSNAAAHRSLGHALVQVERPQNAENAYRKALKLQPTNLETLNNLSALLFQREAYRETIEHSLQALDRERQEPEVVKRLAYAYVNTGQLAKAEKRFNQALSLNPSSELRKDYALVLFNQEKFEKATLVFQKVSAQEVSQDGQASTETLRALAECYYSLGLYQDAIRALDKINSRVEGDRSVIQKLAISHEKAGNNEKAKEYRGKLNE